MGCSSSARKAQNPLAKAGPNVQETGDTKTPEILKAIPIPKRGDKIDGADVVDLKAIDTLKEMERSWDIEGPAPFDTQFGLPALPPDRSMHELHLKQLNNYKRYIGRHPQCLPLDVLNKRWRFESQHQALKREGSRKILVQDEEGATVVNPIVEQPKAAADCVFFQ